MDESNVNFNGKIGSAHAPYHVTGWYGSSKTTYLESATQICLFTIQLLWGYNDD